MTGQKETVLGMPGFTGRFFFISGRSGDPGKNQHIRVLFFPTENLHIRVLSAFFCVFDIFPIRMKKSQFFPGSSATGARPFPVETDK
jgi:hypothetical protein